MTEINSVCVYCGSQPGNDPEFLDQARALGKILAETGTKLVYGGGTTGIMGAVAGSAFEHGGKVTGIIPDFLLEREAKHMPEKFCTDVIVTDSMHERKQTMFEHSDAFVTLPGGIGTLEEIIEMMTWAQLGRHEKPICFLDIKDFWLPLFELLEHMGTTGFIHSSAKLRTHVAKDASDILGLLQS